MKKICFHLYIVHWGGGGGAYQTHVKKQLDHTYIFGHCPQKNGSKCPKNYQGQFGQCPN